MAQRAPSTSAAAGLLGRQLKAMQSDKDIPGISCGLVDDKNVFEWEVMLMINDDVKYYGGMSLPPLPYLLEGRDGRSAHAAHTRTDTGN